MISAIATQLLVGLLLSAIGQPHPPAGGAPFSFIVIGDAGETGDDLDGNARTMRAAADRLGSEGAPVSLLLFLGDNFYPNGLNHDKPEKRRQLIREILTPHDTLMRRLGPANVHAVAGNHDYFCGTHFKIPYGTCDIGNGYEAQIPEWTYHYHYPGIVRRATGDGSADSVDFILFDSALLLTQKIPAWRPVLDSLERLLRASAAAPGVSWRIIAAHHSPYSVGEHGGYRLWLASLQRVGYLGNCYKERQDPLKYIEEMISDQDNCTDKYRAYSDSLMAVVSRSGAHVQMLMAGHDHSLQMLYYPDRGGPLTPKVFMISGAGSKRGRVKSPNPPSEYTHPLNDPTSRGLSVSGFSACTFVAGELVVQFYDGRTGAPTTMGGATSFRVNSSGVLTAVP